MTRIGCTVLATAFACGALVLAGGCSGPSRAALEGNVTFDGQPIPGGAVRLFPIDGTPGDGAAVAVKNGRYAFPLSTGLVAGPYRVSVMGWDAGPPANASHHRPSGDSDGRSPEVIDPLGGPRQLIPAQYNEQTTLTIAIEPGTNQKDWEL